MSISDDLQKLFPVKGKAVIESIASRLQVQESGNNRTYEVCIRYMLYSKNG